MITLSRDVLAEALSDIKAATSAKTTIPILSNVLIDAGDNGLRVMGTDLTAEAAAWVLTDPCEPWRTTVNADLLSDAVRSLPSGAMLDLEPTTGPSRLKVTSGRARFNMPSLPADDFPIIAEHDWKASFDVEATDLAHLLERAGWAYSTNESKYFISGPHLHVSTDTQPRLVLVSTDGNRLALASITAPEGAGSAPPVTLPPRTAQALQKVLVGVTGEVAVSVSDTLARFTAAGWQITTKLIEKGFPDYGRLKGMRRDEHPRRFVAKIDGLKAAVRRALVAADDKENSIILSIEPAMITLSARGDRSGDAADQLDIEYDAEPVRLGLNGTFLLTSLDRLGAGDVEVALTDPASPIVLTGDDPASFAILMPQRI